MSEKKNSLKLLSIVEIVVGIVYAVEGLIVASGKVSYFASAAATVITGVLCYLAVNDASKAKPANFLLWVTVALNALGIILAVLNKGGLVAIGTGLVDLCIALYMIKLIKEIHG